MIGVTQQRADRRLFKDGSVLRQFVPIGRLKYGNSLLRVIHEVTHFTHSHEDARDSYDRPLYVTLHSLVSLETERMQSETLAEVPQFSLYRERAPSQSEWPRAVVDHRFRLINAARAQIFTRHYVCDDEEYELSMRRELPSRRTS